MLILPLVKLPVLLVDNGERLIIRGRVLGSNTFFTLCISVSIVSAYQLYQRINCISESIVSVINETESEQINAENDVTNYMRHCH